jgi:chemotaxis protein MotB
MAKNRDGATIIIKKEEVVGGGHHGGAWKVAYADFVTAMMAFFLLMWLLNATTEQQRRGLANYFSPTNILGQAATGSGEPFGGHTPNDDGSMVSDQGAKTVNPGAVMPPPESDTEDGLQKPATSAGDADTSAGKDQTTAGGGGGLATAKSVAPVQADYLAQAASGSAAKLDPAATDASKLAEKALRAELAQRERAAFVQAAQAIRDAVAADPALADLTEPVSITGHTDATPYRGADRTNWELSSERANATRRLLTEAGLPEARFASVSGRADREPLLPGDPQAAGNRRIAIVVLRAPAAYRASGPVPR